MKKLPPGTRVVVVHVHPRHRREVLAELEALRLPGVEVGRFGEAYDL